MIDGKFVFTKKIFAAVSGFFRLIRMVRESSRMDQRAEKDSGEGPRGQLGEAYERRMRRFNLEAIVFALSALTILIAMVVHRKVGFFSKIAVLSCRFG